ncbi:RNA polymerase sigma factor, partial [Rubrivirga sp.]|uniref:RNA polymerase sigma factor n=1 Tax=Rubrivirga sp. TaxID=1885344 RepID=UPI003C72E675
MTFAAALAPHYDDALRFCRSLCADWGPDQAEDVLHDAMVRAHGGFDGLRDLEAFRPWLFRTIARTHHNARRWRFWRRLVPLEPRSQAPAVYARSEPAAEARDLLRALAALPERDRTTLLLFEVGGFSVDEVAEIVGDRTASAVKSRLS